MILIKLLLLLSTLPLVRLKSESKSKIAPIIVEHSTYTMEQINYGHSLKNIPVPDKKTYLQMLVNSTEKFMKNLRWKTFFYLNPNDKPDRSEKYGFKSIKAAPGVPEIKAFEDDLIDLVKNVEFDKNLNHFKA